MINLQKENGITELLQNVNNWPEDSYPVIEVVTGCLQHTHIKGTKGGNRVSIDET